MNIRERMRQRAICRKSYGVSGIKKSEWICQANRCRKQLYMYCKLNLPKKDFDKIISSKYYSEKSRLAYHNRIMPFLIFHDGYFEQEVVEHFFGKKYPETEEWCRWCIKEVESCV